MADPAEYIRRWMERLEQKWTALEDRVEAMENEVICNSCRLDELIEREAEREKDN